MAQPMSNTLLAVLAAFSLAVGFAAAPAQADVAPVSTAGSVATFGDGCDKGDKDKGSCDQASVVTLGDVCDKGDKDKGVCDQASVVTFGDSCGCDKDDDKA